MFPPILKSSSPDTLSGTNFLGSPWFFCKISCSSPLSPSALLLLHRKTSLPTPFHSPPKNSFFKENLSQTTLPSLPNANLPVNAKLGISPRLFLSAQRLTFITASRQALTRAERKSYIAAEKCLQSKPSKAKLEAAKSRFDDLVKAHQIPALAVHGSGNFLPFHRAFVNAHELLLRTECGYKGYQPYWAEEVDIGKIFQSELLLADKEVGFGGTGKAPDWCVNDGAFKDYVVSRCAEEAGDPKGSKMERSDAD